MVALFQLITELETIRKCPQFLFNSPISPRSAIRLREAILSYLQTGASKKEVDFIIDSPGGSPGDAYRILRTLRKNFDKVNIIVPFWSKSASTLLSLGGSMIIMDEWGEFGALDAQLPKQRDDSPYLDDSESALIDEISLETLENRSHRFFMQLFISIYKSEDIPIHKNDIANDVFNYLSKFYEPLLKQINPYKIGDKKRILEIGSQYANRILLTWQKQITPEERKIFIDYLVNDCPDHGYIVDFDMIKEFLPNLNLLQSKELDKDFKGYSSKLSKVSMYLLKNAHKQENYVGFVNKTLLPPSDVTANGNLKSKSKDSSKNKSKKIRSTQNPIQSNQNGQPKNKKLQSASELN